MLGLLWVTSSLSTNSSTASIEDKVGSRPYKKDMIQINLLYDGEHKYEIECTNMFSMV